MSPLLQLDHHLIADAPGLENPALTVLFVLLSAWWVKGPLLVAAALCSDLWRRRVPLAFMATGAAVLATSVVVDVVKNLVDRQRPPVQQAGLDALVPTPDNPSFPSGHAATTFAAAAAIAVLCPRLRWPALALAAAVSFSRIYLRVHFPLDVLAGAALGGAVGLLCGFIALRALRLVGPSRPA